MAFCKFCGKEIPEGSVCSCPDAVANSAPQQSVNLSKGADTQPQPGGFAAQPQQNNFGQPQGTPVMDGSYGQPQFNNGASAPADPAKEKAKKNLIAIGGGLVLLLIFILIIKAFAGGGYKAPIKDFVKAMNKCDAERLYESMYPDDYIEEMIDDSDYKDEDDFFEERSEDLEDLMDELEDEYGKNAKIKIKFESKKELSKSKLDDYEETYEAICDEKVRITKGYEVECELTIKGREDDDSDNVEFYAFKIKGEGWKILPTSLSSLL